MMLHDGVCRGVQANYDCNFRMIPTWIYDFHFCTLEDTAQLGSGWQTSELTHGFTFDSLCIGKMKGWTGNSDERCQR